MWWNKGPKQVFIAKDGKLRAGWRLILAVLCYMAWTSGITALLSYAFGALFSGWGLTPRNLAYAPGYARLLAENYGLIISAVSSAGAAVFACLAARKYSKLRFSPSMAGIGALTGIASVLLAAGIFLALDSVRMPSGSPDLSFWPAARLPVYLAAAAAEEFFARGYVLRMVSARSGRIWGYLASAAIFLYMTGGYALNMRGVVNMLLFSAALCALSERHSHWLSLGARFGWSYAVTCLFAFPGAVAGRPAVTLYSVSEEWLTGGPSGLISGLYMSILLAAALYFLLFSKHRFKP